MSSILQRVRELDLPLDQFVVIGSGVLDALQLRTAGDVDVVVTPATFEVLRQRDGWTLSEEHGEPVMRCDDTEVFLSWGSETGEPNFDALYGEALVIDGIHFASPRFLIDWKRGRGSDKDLRDITLLEGYLSNER